MNVDSFLPFWSCLAWTTKRKSSFWLFGCCCGCLFYVGHGVIYHPPVGYYKNQRMTSLLCFCCILAGIPKELLKQQHSKHSMKNISIAFFHVISTMNMLCSHIFPMTDFWVSASCYAHPFPPFRNHVEISDSQMSTQNTSLILPCRHLKTSWGLLFKFGCL